MTTLALSGIGAVLIFAYCAYRALSLVYTFNAGKRYRSDAVQVASSLIRDDNAPQQAKLVASVIMINLYNHKLMRMINRAARSGPPATLVDITEISGEYGAKLKQLISDFAMLSLMQNPKWAVYLNTKDHAIFKMKEAKREEVQIVKQLVVAEAQHELCPA